MLTLVQVSDEQGDALKQRTRRFALDVLELLKHLPDGEPGVTIKRQIAKSATSIAANYRSSRRARSHAEFTSRIGLVAEEADETMFWLGLIADARLIASAELSRLRQEASELTAIFSACAGTARRNARQNR